MNWHILKAVCNEKSDLNFILDIKGKQLNLEITIFEKADTWSAQIADEVLETITQQFKKNTTAEQYLEKLRHDLNGDNVEIKFSESVLNIQVILASNIKKRYLQCKLSKVQNQFKCYSALLQELYAEKNKVFEKMLSLQVERDQLQSYVTQLESKLSDFNSRKKKDEDTLYSNFVLVLNEKKIRIQHLTELLEAFRHGRPTVNPTINVQKNKKKSKVEVKNEVSESDTDENETDYNTDDEQPGRKEFNENFDHSIPSSSKTNNPSLVSEHTVSFPSLPKRVKHDTNIESTIHNIPVKLEPTQQETISLKNTPNIVKTSYSTQDLLDEL